MRWMLHPLSRVFRKAREVEFDDQSKLLLISDCHRGDGSLSDDFAQNRELYFTALQKYYQAGFSYFELGDGDELWENRTVAVSVALYRDIFESLSRFYREGRLYFLYGNHDLDKGKPGFIDREYVLYDQSGQMSVPLFPGIEIHQGIVLRHRQTGEGIFLVHGHQVDLISGTLWPISRFLVRHVWRPLELAGLDLSGRVPESRWSMGGVVRRLEDWGKKNRQLIITGHTHRLAFPEPGQSTYFNGGSSVRPGAVTALEIEDGSISLVQWHWELWPDGRKLAVRHVLAGPRTLRAYFDRLKEQTPQTVG